MYKSKLVEVFYALLKPRQRALLRFVRSPYFNRRQDVVALCEYLLQYDLTDRQALEKERVWAALFPDQPYDAAGIDHLMSFLLKLLERFLVVEHIEEDAVGEQLALSQIYRKMGIEKHFQQSLQQARRLHERLPFRDPDFLEKAAKIELEEYAFSTKQSRSAPRNLQTLSDRFDNYYLAQRLQVGCLLLAHRSVYKTEYDMASTQTAIRFVEEHPERLDIPAIALYYYYLKAILNQQDIELFRAFKKCLFEHTALLPHQEIYNLYIFAINYCVQQFNSGNDQLLPEVFELYKSGLERRILLEQGKLSAFAFKNITDIALRLNQTQWAESFVRDYQGFLDEKHRAGYVSYALSKLYYQQKRYKDAMLQLQEVEQDDLFLTLSGKVTLIKIYYELGEYDALEALLSSFRIFIHRKKQLPQTRRDNYQNIIKFARKLLQINPYNAKEKNDLADEIRATRQLTEKEWFLKMVNG